MDVLRAGAVHRHLRYRDIFAVNSSKRGDPRAKLLSGAAWKAAKPLVLASLGLPALPEQHLAERAALLHATFTDVIDRLATTPQPGSARTDGCTCRRCPPMPTRPA